MKSGTTPLPDLEIDYSPGVSPLTDAHRRILLEIKRGVAARHPLPTAVQLILTDDAFIRRLNASYRGKDQSTDVLSFDLGPNDPPGEAPDGEVYISVERARGQAREQDVEFIEELGRLLTHGLLHLSGFDHQTPAQLQIMEGATDEIMSQVGLLPSSLDS